jgi:hypothetical protein
MTEHNPYESPASEEQSLNKQQCRALASLAAFRRHRSAVRLLVAQWKFMLAIAVLCASILSLSILAPLDENSACLLAGMAVGLFTASASLLLALCLAQKRNWPMYEQIINWQRVDELLP